MGQQTISDNARLHSAVEPQSSGYETLVQTNDDGLYVLSVLVSGVHCAGCIQKIESSLAREQGIRGVRLNFSTRRLALEWEGTFEQANAYVAIIEALGYSVQPYDIDVEKSEIFKEERFLLLCLGVAGFAMGNVMLLSVGLWSTTTETMGIATRDFMHWVSALIALPTILFSGRPFFRSAIKALSAGHTNMDVPISLALVLAGGMSLFETVNHGEHVYFDSAVMLIFFLLIGRYLDFRARKNARSTATDLLSSLSGFANVVGGGGFVGNTNRILIRDLEEGMIVRVAAGEKFPIDGFIIDGESDIDTSLVTGETMPRTVCVGAEIFAGTLNLSAPVTIKVAAAAEDSLLADIVRLMEKAGQGQAQYVRLADRAARLYTPVVHSCAVLAFIGWWIVGGLVWQDALMVSITVLIITCPCALGLAVPVVQVLATGRLMREGILVKSGDALERLSDIDTVMFDKTGTLTLGQPTLDGVYDNDMMQMAASLTAHSAHPLSRALSDAYDGVLYGVSNVEEISGKGVRADYNGQLIKIGSRAWCGDMDVPQSKALELWLNIAGQPPVAFRFIDHVHKDAAEVVEKFIKNGIDVVMLSGDRQAVADDIARQCGIFKVYAEQTPTQKYDVLERFKRDGHKVLMVGDGLNDAPVLAGADVSFAPGTAIDMAQNAADIVFMGGKLHPVYATYKVANLTQKLVKQNFALAVLYNMIAVPLALAGFVTPLIAAVAMSGSSLIVIANSFRLRFSA